MSRVERRDAVGADPLDQPLGGVVGVDGAQLGLDRGRRVQLILIADLPDVAVQGARETDHGVRIDQAGSDDGRFQHLDAVGDGRLVRGTDPFDRAVVGGNHDGVLERFPGHGVEDVRPHDHLRGGRRRRGAGQGRGQRQEQHNSTASRTRAPLHCPSPSRRRRSASSSPAVVR